MNWWPLAMMFAGALAYIYTFSRLNSMSKKQRRYELLKQKQLAHKRLSIFLSFASDDHREKESMMEMMWLTKAGKEEAKIRDIEQRLMDL